MNITVYKVKYLSSTDTKPSRFKVTRMDDGISREISYDFGADNAVTDAVGKAFNQHPDSLQFVGCLTKNESLYAGVWQVWKPRLAA